MKCCPSSVLKTKAICLHQDLKNDQAGPAENPEPPPLCTEATRVSAGQEHKLQHRHLESDSFPLFSTVTLTAVSSKKGLAERKDYFWPC